MNRSSHSKDVAFSEDTCQRSPKNGASKFFLEMVLQACCELEGAPDPNRVEVVDEIRYCGDDVGLRLCGHLLQLKNHKLHFDNYFTYL